MSEPSANHAIDRVRIWAEMIKLSHSVFVLPFALIATFLAGREMPNGLPYSSQIILIVLSMVFARCVAMTYNRLVDAEIDRTNPRTALRALPAGRISWRAAMFFLGMSIGAFLATTLGFWRFHQNRWPAVFALPVLALLCGYSYTKRFTQWSHVILGVALGLSPIAAWVAIHPETLGAPAIMLSAAVALWIGGFDIIYACQDVAFDRSAGLFSLPARWGVGRSLWVTRGFHLITVGLLAGLAPVAGLGTIYLAGVVAVAVLLLVENLMVRANDLSRVNVAFFTVNGIVSVVLGAAAIADIVLARAG